MKITRTHLKRLIREVMVNEAFTSATEETSKFQSTLNDFLDSSGIEPGVGFYWNDEDTLVVRGSETDASDIQTRISMGLEMEILNTGSSTMNPAVVELEDGNWAIKLNAQMTQDRI
jgi:hypothetical protein